MSAPAQHTKSGHRKLKGHKRPINTPKTPDFPIKNKNKNKQKFWAVLEHFPSQILSLFLTKFSPKHIKKPLISLFSQQSRGSVLALFFLSLVLGPWI